MKPITPSASSSKIQAIAALGKMIAVGLFCWSTSVIADRPPTEVGTFTRSDGVVVKAIKWEVDSFIGYGGTNCWFELPDGTHIAVPEANDGKSPSSTRWERDCVIRISTSAAEIYRFSSDERLIASRVLRFDGYRFSDAMTPEKRWLSPLVHTWAHIGDYLAPLVVFAVLVLLHRSGKQIDKQTNSKKVEDGVIRGLWFLFYALTILYFAWLMLLIVTGLVSSISPLVFLILFLIELVLLRWVGRLARRNMLSSLKVEPVVNRK